MHIFCAASETARDVCKQLTSEPDLPPHDLEDIIMPSEMPPLKAREDETDSYEIDAFLQLIEVCVDDFTSVVQVKSANDLQHATRMLLHGIERIFPDSMSMSKLHKEGKWESKKKDSRLDF